MSAELQWQVGDVRITRILEQEFEMPAERLLDRYSAQRLEEHGSWLRPHHLGVGGELRMAYQSFLIESAGKRIVVDPGRGDDRPLPAGRPSVRTDYLANLLAVLDPSDVDLVVCTHLHYDHIGWNVRQVDGEWQPTFPRARYLFSRPDFRFWSEEGQPSPNVDLTYGVDMIVGFGRHDLVEPDHRLTPEVSLFATPGHSPGHASIRISSAGQEAVITGDAAHHPVQLAEPGWTTKADSDAALAVKTRTRLAEAVVGRDTLVIGTHFAAPCAGVLRATNQGYTRLVSEN
jgi:glyoxylase-like metal-dependent hydrolase (beta-lactamase superfamily II)